MALDPLTLYRELYRIRRFEEAVLEEFPRGRFYGTTHTSLGQEANAVGVLSELQTGDVVVSNHRCHGHFLAYGGDMRSLFAELMGKASGISGGRGGSQQVHWQNFFSSGVLGGTLPVATGMALAEKLQGRNTVVVAFLGDGALGEGVLYEALNMASLWRSPILFVLENNGIAQTTPIELNLAGDIPVRFQAFGIPTEQLDSADVVEIQQCAGNLLCEVRTSPGPRALVIRTRRFGPHSKGDDTRPAEVVERLRRDHDPIAIHGARLPRSEREAIQAEVDAEITQALQLAIKDPFPEAGADERAHLST